MSSSSSSSSSSSASSSSSSFSLSSSSSPVASVAGKKETFFCRFSHLWAAPLQDNHEKQVPQLDIEDEQKLLRRTLEQSRQPIVYESAVAHAKSLQRAMLHADGACSVVHFTCHGTEEGGLALEYEHTHSDKSVLGKTNMFSSQDMRRLLFLDDAGDEGGGSQPRTLPQLVFVSACHSEPVGMALVDLGVQHVVAVDRRTEVMDDASKEFAEKFYESLLAGGTVIEAFKRARSLVWADFVRELENQTVEAPSSENVEHKKFLLLPKEGDGYHDKALFPPQLSLSSKPSFQDLTSSKASGAVQTPTPLLVGRAREVRELYKALHHPVKRVAVVTGDPGVGKTTVALRALQYTSDRSEFAAIMHLNLSHGELDEEQGPTPDKQPHDDPNVVQRVRATRVGSFGCMPCCSTRERLIRRLHYAQSRALGGIDDHDQDSKDPEALLDHFIDRANDGPLWNNGRLVLFLDHCDEWLVHGGGQRSEERDDSTAFPPLPRGSSLGSARELDNLISRLCHSCEHLRVVLCAFSLPGRNLVPGADRDALPPPPPPPAARVSPQRRKSTVSSFTFLKEVEHEEVRVQPLDAYNTALLFMRWAKRGLSAAEITDADDSLLPMDDPVACFAQHRIVSALEGHPGAAVRTAACVTKPPRAAGSQLDTGGDCLELVERATSFCTRAAESLRQYRERRRALLDALACNRRESGRTTSLAVPFSPPASAPLHTLATTQGTGEVLTEFGAFKHHEWWHGDLPNREASKQRLRAERQKRRLLAATPAGTMQSCSLDSVADGIFLVRPSSKGSGFYACDIYVNGGTYLPMLIRRVGDSPEKHRFILEQCKEKDINLGGPKEYKSLEQLIFRNQEYLKTPCPRLNI